MAARVIHYGVDNCHRLTILRSLGYSVDDCSSLLQLREALTAGNKTGAVFITEDEPQGCQAAVSLAKSCTSAPLVLFRRSNADCCEGSFDLVIESLTPPQDWLHAVQGLITRCRSLSRRVQ